LSFSSDGHAGLAKKDASGQIVSLTKAPIFHNLLQVQVLVNEGNMEISDAIKLVTVNPAKNLSLAHKGRIQEGADADFCCFDDKMNLLDVWCKGKLMMNNNKVLVKGSFEK